jgi:hypothetical protein
MRRTETQGGLGKGISPNSPDVLRSGIEGYAAHMKRYPLLSREQTEAALAAYRSGQSLDMLRGHALFKSHLEQEERDLFQSPGMYDVSPIHSFRQLFADSPTLAHFVSFGNFPTLLYWVNKFQTTYSGLPLAIEEFMQNALYKFIPDAARRYTPLPGSSFKSYLSKLLIRRLDGLVDICITERSILPRGAHKEGLKPKHDRRRVYIASLDAPVSESRDAQVSQETDTGEEVSLYDLVENTKATIPGEDLERSDAIRRLFTVAGITQEEAQVLQTYVIEGERQDYAATFYGVTTRTIRGRRDQAVKKFRQLGYERILGILSGEADG